MRYALALPLLICSLAHAAPPVISDPKALAIALKTAVPGDTLLLAPGVWTDAQLVIPPSVQGTKDKPITLRAQVPGKTILSGKSTLRIGGQFVVVDGLAFRDFADTKSLIEFRTASDKPASDCTLTNTSIASPLPTDNDGTIEAHWLGLYGKRNTVSYCHLQGKRTGSPMLTVWVSEKPDDPDLHHIHHNLFGGREPLGKNGGETMRVGTSQVSMHTSQTLVEDNYFEYCNGEAEIISNKSCDNTYRRNVFFESKGALVMRHGNRATVQDNYFFGNNVKGTGGIRLTGEDHKILNNHLENLAGEGFESAFPICDGIPNSPLNGYFQVKRAVIANNIVLNCKQTLTFGIGTGQRSRSQPAQNLTFTNNLFASTHTPPQTPLIITLNPPENTTWENNEIQGTPTGLPETPGLTVVTTPSTGSKRGPQSPPINRAETGPRWLPAAAK